jgi:hypothetical protein
MNIIEMKKELTEELMKSVDDLDYLKYEYEQSEKEDNLMRRLLR